MAAIRRRSEIGSSAPRKSNEAIVVTNAAIDIDELVVRSFAIASNDDEATMATVVNDDNTVKNRGIATTIPVVRDDRVLRRLAGAKRSWSKFALASRCRTAAGTTAAATTAATADSLESITPDDVCVVVDNDDDGDGDDGGHDRAFRRYDDDDSIRSSNGDTSIGCDVGPRRAKSRKVRSRADDTVRETSEFLGCFAYDRSTRCAARDASNASRTRESAAVATAAAKASSNVAAITPPTAAAVATAGNVTILPPYEYCSIAMLNQARAGRSIHDLITDKGGTIKTVLQSNKSLLHYLTTNPLKYTFRGYIQIAPYMMPHHIGMPRHHALRIFSIDTKRDARRLTRRPPLCDECVRRRRRRRGCFDTSANSGTGRLRRCKRCPFWPDESFDLYFETNCNFGLVVKRDPCLHNGSTGLIRRVYVQEARDYAESILLSPLVLKNMNADFDGDAVTVMIVRGIESTCELNECLREPLLYGAIPRFTFCQSTVYRVFRRLCFANDEDAEGAFTVAALVDRDLVKRVLSSRLDVWRDEGARRRALDVFGPWYAYYEKALARAWRREIARRRCRRRDGGGDGGGNGGGDDDDWSAPIWPEAVLDHVHVGAVRDGHGDGVLEWITRGESLTTTMATADDDRHDDDVTFLRENVLSLENWLIVHSGAKSSPSELWRLHERYESAIANSSGAAPQNDFFEPCTAERALEYHRYLDDFVTISKNVPKSSYFASGLKWVMQTCVARNGDLVMHGRVILRNLRHYLRDVEKDFYH